ncbi:MAG: LemA family protein [Planctomycetes bacterium]|nr:LemA family protein [Planctomycetota bacterium]
MSIRPSLVVLGVLLLLVLGIGGCGVGRYNSLAKGKVAVEAKWAEIDNQYKRRNDLVPNLVATVKGAANFEQKTLTDVTEARAAVGRLQMPSTLPTDPAQLDAYIKAQQGLSGALGRLFAVAENYPALKATENFRDLQSQIEGTENRITVARRDYIDAIQSYEAGRAVFPGNLIAGMFHFEKIPQPSIAPEERAVPKVDFGTDAK